MFKKLAKYISSNLKTIYKAPEDLILEQGQLNQQIFFMLAGNVDVVAWSVLNDEERDDETSGS